MLGSGRVIRCSRIAATMKTWAIICLVIIPAIKSQSESNAKNKEVLNGNRNVSESDSPSTNATNEQVINKLFEDNGYSRNVSDPEGELSNATNEEILNRLFEENDYNRNVRPGSNMGEATAVSIGFFIQSLSSVSEINMDYSVDLYLRQLWNDPRLSFNNTDRIINTGPYYVDKLWRPDPYFVNSKEEAFRTVTAPNVLLRISPNGDVFYSQRLTLVLSCNMVLAKFPMDEQVCDMRIMSFGYGTNDIALQWMKEGSLNVNEENELPEFSLTKTDKKDCTEVYVTGTFSCLAAQFFIARRIEYYVAQTYLPTVLIVIISWVNFWIDPRAIPARVTLGLICVLTMTTQSTGVQSKLPKVSYVKAMDVWFNVCLVFVFAGLLEFACVSVQRQKHEKKTEKNKARQNGNENVNTNGDDVVAKFKGTVEGERGEANQSYCSKMWRKRDFDRMSRFIFPTVFAIFNVVYWVYYKT